MSKCYLAYLLIFTRHLLGSIAMAAQRSGHVCSVNHCVGLLTVLTSVYVYVFTAQMG